MPNLNLESKSFTKQDFRDRAFNSFEFFCKKLFPDAFFVEFGDVHREIFSLILSEEQYVGVIAPRKIGKTPMICFAFPLRQILFNMEAYIVIVSATIEEAGRHVDKITTVIEQSAAIHYYFGELVIKKEFETQKNSVQFANRIWLRAKGLGSQIRGTGGDWSPPSLIVVDDPQSNKDVKTETNLNNASNWFDDEVIYSKAKKWKHKLGKVMTGKIRFLGTSLHPQCLAEKLYKDSRFKFLRYSILQNEAGEPDIVHGKSIWEAMFPTVELYQEMQDAERNGKLGNWLQERMNMPYKYGERMFDVDDLQYWNIGDNKFDIYQGMPVFVQEQDVGLNTA
ncbi:MAG: hypothetical protein KAS32_16505 [Candidatus Peribacteraceae bacterium]|nr:hypothetical protein [Candidatus Peribacteraceae bacterium]